MAAIRKPLTPTKARNAALVNLCATPGLGTIFCGRVLTGATQLAIAVTGFGFVVAWFISILRQFYSLIENNNEVRPVGWIGLTGLGIFAVAWIWSLFTSFSLLTEARRNAPHHLDNPTSPPPLP